MVLGGRLTRDSGATVGVFGIRFVLLPALAPVAYTQCAKVPKLMAEFRASSHGWIDALAVVFLCLRLAFVLAYLANLSAVRTVLWNVGFLVNAAIFFLPAFQH